MLQKGESRELAASFGVRTRVRTRVSSMRGPKESNPLLLFWDARAISRIS